MSTENTTTEGAEPIEAPTTLAEFREQFPSAPKADDPPADPITERAPRRAQSHKAEPKDVPVIAALTKQLREAEDAIKIERHDGESDRVFQLRKRAEIAKLASRPAPAAQPSAPREPARPVAVTQPIAFTEKEPVIEDFKDKPDPWLALTRATAAYDRRKDAFDAAQSTQTAQYEAQAQQFNHEINHGIQAHAERAVAYANSRPDVKALFDAEASKPPQDQIQLTLAMRGAIEFHEKGPEMIVALLQSPELADEIFLLTTGRAVGDPRTDSLVATVRRRLLQRISGAPSGSPAPQRVFKPAPRPPNPERTVPQTPRDSSPSDAPGSLAEHRRQFPTRH